jgi:Protein of unknown function (DUF4232)
MADLETPRPRRRLGIAMLVVAVLAGAGGGAYALARAFGVGSSRHVTSTTHLATSGTSTSIGRCSDLTASVSRASQEGAAGTISTVWRVKNTSSRPCRSSGYPGMDFHTASGWLNVQVHRGGYANIDQSPKPIVVPAGQSLRFTSYWGDATTSAGPCRAFDRVKVTQPDNTTSAEVASTGCLNADSVYVGPVTRAPNA